MKKFKLSNIIFIICLCVFIFSGYRLLNIYLEYKKGSSEYDNLKNEIVSDINKNSDNNGKKEDNNGKKEGNNGKKEDNNGKKEGNNGKKEPKFKSGQKPPIKVNFEELKATNPDIIGWIYMESIPSINYPILKGNDNNYYLRHTYKHTYNIAGSIFVDYRNDKDFLDFNTLIYGHNMKNGTMFSKLDELKNNPNLAKEKPYIWIFAPNKIMVYKIFSVHETPYDSNTYTIFKDKDGGFDDYQKQAINSNMIKNLDETLDGDRMATLSTCTDNDHIRMVVQCKLVDIVENN